MTVRVEKRPLAAPFEISGYVFDSMELVVVTLSDGQHTGTGEASGVYYLDDNVGRIVRDLEKLRPAIEGGLTREELQAALCRSGARNALDCALWALEAAQAGKSVADLQGICCRPLETTFTIGVGEPRAMAAKAVAMPEARAIKLKLAGVLDADLARVAAVRAARPEIWLGVDANQGFSRFDLDRLVEGLRLQGVALLEQPLPRGREEELRGLNSPVPVAADESVLDSADLEKLVGLFDVINIKLDKCGGLTEAMVMADRARKLGIGVMVGNMIGTSRAMAPAFLLGQQCDVIDLDGPTFLAADSELPVTYAHGTIRINDSIWANKVSI